MGARIKVIVGFALQNPPSDEEYPDKWVESFTEKPYYAELMRNQMAYWSEANKTIDDLTFNHSISILANDFINKNGAMIKYVIVRGVKWRVTSIEFQWPRIILSVGGLYNGNS